MKTSTLSVIVLFALSTLVISCSKDSGSKDDSIPQEQLEAIAGLYNMTEYRIRPAQDLNGDSVFSENLMDELDCQMGSIILREDLSYSWFNTELAITFITNEQYAIFCDATSTRTGTWDLVNNQIVLSRGDDGTYSLNGDTLTRTEGNALPDFEQLVFVKQ